MRSSRTSRFNRIFKFSCEDTEELDDVREFQPSVFSPSVLYPLFSLILDPCLTYPSKTQKFQKFRWWFCVLIRASSCLQPSRTCQPSTSKAIGILVLSSLLVHIWLTCLHTLHGGHDSSYALAPLSHLGESTWKYWNMLLLRYVWCIPVINKNNNDINTVLVKLQSQVGPVALRAKP